MSYGTPSILQGVKAGEDLTGKEGLAVKISADNTVVQSTLAADVVIGTIHAGNANGKAVEIAGLGKQFEAVAGAVIAAGAELTMTTGGKVITAVSTNIVIGVAITAAAADGDYINAMSKSYVKA